jgi:hypothetical protein
MTSSTSREVAIAAAGTSAGEEGKGPRVWVGQRRRRTWAEMGKEEGVCGGLDGQKMEWKGEGNATCTSRVKHCAGIRFIRCNCWFIHRFGSLGSHRKMFLSNVN